MGEGAIEGIPSCRRIDGFDAPPRDEADVIVGR
jgi:hypothetical protein